MMSANTLNCFTINYNVPINVLPQNSRIKQQQSLFRERASGLTQTWVLVLMPSPLAEWPQGDLADFSLSDALLRAVERIRRLHGA